MWKKFVTFLLLICSMQYVGTSKIVKRYVYSGAGTGAGAYSNVGSRYIIEEPRFGYDFQIPFFQQLGSIVPAEYNKQFSNYLLEFQKNQAAAASMTYTTHDATASASTFLFPSDNLYKQHLKQQQAIRQQAGIDYGYNAPNYATASAYYNPSEIHQTAYISPSNPKSPNIDVRYASSGSGQPNNKFYGVSSSSFSESSNINGQKSSRRGAITTVNDNGKITTYESNS